MKIIRLNLTGQVVAGMVLGIALGVLAPNWAVGCAFINDIFVRLVKMVISPIVFITLVTGMAGMGSLKQVGKLGARALLWFEVCTAVALGLGIVLSNWWKPGAGIEHHAVAHPDSMLSAPMAHADWHAFLLTTIPDNGLGALAAGNMLAVLVFALLFGAALTSLPEQEKTATLATFVRLLSIFFAIVNLVMKLSPYAAFGAMAVTVGRYGLGSLWALGRLVIAIYAAMALFVFVGMGSVARVCGFRITRLLAHIREELILVFGTSSSESALPGLMRKLEAWGCDKTVVGLVVPTGYSFNLDGTALYLSMALLFMAQAYNVTLSWHQQLVVFGVLMLTSKGAAGVTGSGFVTLAATLAAMPDLNIPLEGLALIIGVDRFLSTGRAVTNLIGNSVATVMLAKAQGQFQPPASIRLR